MSRKAKAKGADSHKAGVKTSQTDVGAHAPSASSEPTPSWWRQVIREPAAILLAIIVLLRPWRDGITFPFQNAYYVWAIVLAVTVWGIGALKRGDAIRCVRPISLFVGYLLFASLTAPSSIQYDATYRNLIWWAGHVAVFILASNAVRTPVSVGLVLGAFAIASFLEAVYGYLHLHYILPFTRMLVNLDTRVLSGMGLDGLSPQLANRLESNRAFGTFLFPNALAAYMILGVPYAIGAGVRSYRRLRSALAAAPGRLAPGPSQERRLISVAAGLTAWIIAFVCCGLLMFLVLSPHKYYHLETIAGKSFPVSDPASAHLAVWIWWLAIVPLIPAILTWFVTLRYGVTVSWPGVCVVCAAMLAASEVFTLVHTFSRGGVLGLAVGLIAGALLLWFGDKQERATLVTGKLGGALAASTVALLLAGAIYTNAPAHAESSAHNPEPLVEIQGDQKGVSDALDPTSGHLRLGYWKTGLLMWKDHLVAGVGLGNFGVAYPKYQQLGVSDVKMAHNDYIQVLCETGIVGFVLFAGFWVYFTVWGARRILAETDRSERWVLAGLYGGVAAFLTHSILDFNFQNTSLALNVYLLAGIFYARTAPKRPAPKQRWAHQLSALLILAVAWSVAGAQVRVRAVDNIIDNSSRMHDLPATIADLLHRTDQELFDTNKPPRFRLPDIEELIPDRAEQDSFGKILVVLSNGSSRYLQPGEPVPQDLKTVPWFEVREPNLARTKVYQAIETWVAQLELIDASYPHSPMMGAYICRWCELAQDKNTDLALRKRWILKGQEWAEVLVRRSPYEYWIRSYMGRALFLRASIEPNSQLAIDTLQRGIAQFKEATVLYPTSEKMWSQYGDALEKAGAAFSRAGDSARGDAMIADGRKAKARAEEVKDFKDRTHTGATG